MSFLCVLSGTQGLCRSIGVGTQPLTFLNIRSKTPYLHVVEKLFDPCSMFESLAPAATR